jgi:hypothetical protein
LIFDLKGYVLVAQSVGHSVALFPAVSPSQGIRRAWGWGYGEAGGDLEAVEGLLDVAEHGLKAAVEVFAAREVEIEVVVEVEGIGRGFFGEEIGGVTGAEGDDGGEAHHVAGEGFKRAGIVGGTPGLGLQVGMMDAGLGKGLAGANASAGGERVAGEDESAIGGGMGEDEGIFDF